jgi:hypothetical protein
MSAAEIDAHHKRILTVKSHLEQWRRE